MIRHSAPILFALSVHVALVAQPAVFDVASIKPSPSGSKLDPVVVDTRPGGVFVGRNLTVLNMIQLAWNVVASQVVDGPRWAETYDIDAKVAGIEKMNYEQLMIPMRQLLVERCKILAHEETRPHAIYLLEVLGAGLKLKPSTDNAEPTMEMSWRQLVAHKKTMAELADILSRQLEIRRPVVDRTGLPGEFDFVLDLFPDAIHTPPPSNGSTAATAANRPPPGTQISIFTALREQLGLKLTPAKGTEKVVVIDHIEKPSQN